MCNWINKLWMKNKYWNVFGCENVLGNELSKEIYLWKRASSQHKNALIHIQRTHNFESVTHYSLDTWLPFIIQIKCDMEIETEIH